MRPIGDRERGELERRIVEQFGDATRDGQHNLFDQITRVPVPWKEARRPLEDVREVVRKAAGSWILILDPHPNNAPFAERVARQLGMSEARAAYVNAAEADLVLADEDCDSYLLTPDLEVLIVACHEDLVVDNQRLYWTAQRAMGVAAIESESHD